MKQLIFAIFLLPVIALGQPLSEVDSVRDDALNEVPRPSQVDWTIWANASVLPWLYEDDWLVGASFVMLNVELAVQPDKWKQVKLFLRSGMTLMDGIDLGSPIALAASVGKGKSHVEAVAGVNVRWKEIGYEGLSLAYWPVLELGYRYQRPQGGFVWRAHVGTTGLGLGAGWAF